MSPRTFLQVAETFLCYIETLPISKYGDVVNSCDWSLGRLCFHVAGITRLGLIEEGLWEQGSCRINAQSINSTCTKVRQIYISKCFRMQGPELVVFMTPRYNIVTESISVTKGGQVEITLECSKLCKFAWCLWFGSVLRWPFLKYKPIAFTNHTFI